MDVVGRPAVRMQNPLESTQQRAGCFPVAPRVDLEHRDQPRCHHPQPGQTPPLAPARLVSVSAALVLYRFVRLRHWGGQGRADGAFAAAQRAQRHAHTEQVAHSCAVRLLKLYAPVNSPTVAKSRGPNCPTGGTPRGRHALVSCPHLPQTSVCCRYSMTCGTTGAVPSLVWRCGCGSLPFKARPQSPPPRRLQIHHLVHLCRHRARYPGMARLTPGSAPTGFLLALRSGRVRGRGLRRVLNFRPSRAFKCATSRSRVSTRSTSGASARTNSISSSLLRDCNASRVSRPNLSDRVMPENCMRNSPKVQAHSAFIDETSFQLPHQGVANPLKRLPGK